MRNGFCESFNGRMRDELLNESLFLGLDHARMKFANWADDDNQRRAITLVVCIPRSAICRLNGPGKSRRRRFCKALRTAACQGAASSLSLRAAVGLFRAAGA